MFRAELKAEPLSIPNLVIVPSNQRPAWLQKTIKPKRPRSAEMLPGGTPLAKAVRWFKAQNLFVCFYCGIELVQTRPMPGQIFPSNGKTHDHVVPRSKGGGVKVKCCLWCNGKKGRMDVDDSRKVLTGKRDGQFHGEKLYAEYLKACI